MPNKFTFTAKHGMKKINRLIKMRGSKAVKVGILRGTGDHPNAPGVPIALIAWWNEFGTKKKNGKPHIPSRPFLRTTLREHGYYKEALKRALQASLLKTVKFETDLNQPFRQLGQIAADDIKAKIVEGPWTPNAPGTIGKKSTSSGVKAVPLIESGRMRQSIAWVLSND